MPRLSRALLLVTSFGLALLAATPALPRASMPDGVVARFRALVAFDLCPGGGVLSCALVRLQEARARL